MPPLVLLNSKILKLMRKITLAVLATSRNAIAHNRLTSVGFQDTSFAVPCRALVAAVTVVAVVVSGGGEQWR